MSLLGKFMNHTKMTYTDWNFPMPTGSGEVITTDNAMNVSVVFACIQARANAVAKLPLQIFQETKDGRERSKSHQVSFLLETRPNKYQTPFQFLFATEANRMAHGIAYWKMNINRKGQPESLHILPPSRMSTVIEENGRVHFVENKGKGEAVVYDEEEIIRLPLFSLDGFDVKSPITVAREQVGTLKAQSKFISSFYANGTLSRGVLKIPSQLNKDAKDAVRKAWQDANAGSENASKIAVLDSGVEFDNITIPLQDAEFVASQKFGIEEIARIFNVPLHLIGSLDRATFSNIEQQSMDFIQNTVSPSCIAIEQELNYKLFTRKERKDGMYVKFNMNSSLRGDSQSRANYYQTMLETGVYSINEIRKLEEMDSIGDIGDKHYRSLNFVDIKEANDYQKAKANMPEKGGGNE